MLGGNAEIASLMVKIGDGSRGVLMGALIDQTCVELRGGYREKSLMWRG